jgi:glutathione S-transferase
MNIQKLKLYHMPASRSARVKWVLHEALGDDFAVDEDLAL